MQSSNSCASEPKRIKNNVFARVVGYYRPVSKFNNGKKAEWKERKLIREVQTVQ